MRASEVLRPPPFASNFGCFQVADHENWCCRFSSNPSPLLKNKLHHVYLLTNTYLWTRYERKWFFDCGHEILILHDFYWQIFALNGVPCELEALFGIWATIKSFWNLNTTNSCLDFITTFCHFSTRSCHLSIFPFPLSFTLVSPGKALSTICQAVYCCFLTRLALSQIGQTSGLDWDQVLFQSPLGDPVILMGLFQVRQRQQVY